MLGTLTRKIGIYDLLEPTYARLQQIQWERSGRPVPPPSAVKRKILKQYAADYGLRTLVETGTFRADTVRALRGDFRTIYSIELDANLHKAAVSRCSRQKNAVLLKGDSATVLPEVLSRLDGAALFWLDAHYSGGPTARAAVETPIGQELACVFGHSVLGHVVLVDDFREFAAGAADYPSVALLEELAAAHNYEFAEDADVIRLTPRVRPGPTNLIPPASRACRSRCRLRS